MHSIISWTTKHPFTHKSHWSHKSLKALKALKALKSYKAIIINTKINNLDYTSCDGGE